MVIMAVFGYQAQTQPQNFQFRCQDTEAERPVCYNAQWSRFYNIRQTSLSSRKIWRAFLTLQLNNEVFSRPLTSSSQSYFSPQMLLAFWNENNEHVFLPLVAEWQPWLDLLASQTLKHFALLPTHDVSVEG